MPDTPASVARRAARVLSGTRPDAIRRTAVIDLGSNTFRLVVFSAQPGSWWKRTDEIYEAVRIGAHVGPDGELQPDAIARATRTIDLYAHFLATTGIGQEEIEAVATSAIRDATNQHEFLAQARTSGLPVRVLSREQEARYGYLAALNSSTLKDGVVLDLGGGSLQLVEVRDRDARTLQSWPLGAVRMTERFLESDEPATKKQLKALRTHVGKELEAAPWLTETGRHLVGIGGTVRNLAAAAQRAAELPSFGVQGFTLTAQALDELVTELASRPPARRGGVPGIKPERADVILAGAAVIAAVLELGGFDGIEVTEAGLREGVFFASHLDMHDTPLFPSVPEASVRNLQAQYGQANAHSEHVHDLALQLFDGLAAAGLHDGDPDERRLLAAAGLLHDIGTAVDYDDHHKHSRYLILNAGLPGFSPREVALIAQMARYHRKGEPSLGELAPLCREGDEALLLRCSALLRLAEHLDRSRDGVVRSLAVSANGKAVTLELDSDEDPSLALWGAERGADVFGTAFDRELRVR